MTIKVSHARLSRLAFVAISLLLVLSVFAVTLPQPVQAASDASAPAATCTKNHTVKKDETIRTIANLYGLKWKALAKANDIKYPYTLEVGETLCISTVTGSTTTVSPKMTVSISGFVITITGKSFPKASPYYVKVGKANKYTWYRLGTLVAKKDGTFTRSFLLPKELRSQNDPVSVCLKNARTDALLCQVVYVTAR